MATAGARPSLAIGFGVAVGAALIGCGHHAPAPPPPPPSNRAPEPAPVASVAHHQCAATLIPVPDDGEGSFSDGIFIDAPTEVALTCDEYRRDCQAAFQIAFVNCRAEAITVHSALAMMHFDEPWVDTTATFPHVIAPGATWTIDATSCGEGTTTAEFEVQGTVNRVVGYVDLQNPANNHALREPLGVTGSLSSSSIHIINPARDRDRAACTACNGDWGDHAMVSVRNACPGSDPGDSCVCRSTDGGTACDDGDDCQGWCEADRFVVESAQGSPPVEYGHWIGHCSEFTEQRSCARPIPSGASHQPPAPASITESCVD